MERPARRWADSVRTALTADELDRAVETVQSEWEAHVITDPTLVRETIQALPAAVWQADAWLLLGLASSFSGSSDAVERSGAALFLNESQRLLAAGRPPGTTVERELTTRFGFAKHQRSIGRFDRAAAELDDLALAVGATEDISFEWRLAMDARLQLERSLVAWHRAGFAAGDSSIGPALAIAEVALHPHEQVAAYGLAGLQAVVAENHGRAAMWFDRALAAAEAAELGNDPSEIPLLESPAMAPALFAHALTLLERGRFDAAAEVGPMLERIAGGSEWRAYSAVFTATRLLLLRRYTQALEPLRRARQLSRRWEDAILLDALSYSVRVGIEIGLRRPHAVEPPTTRRVPDPRHVFCAGRYLGWLCIGEGRYQDAIDAIDECIRLGDGHARGTLIDVLLIDATARAALGDAARSATSFDYAIALCADSGFRRAFHHLPATLLSPLLAAARSRPQPDGVVDLLAELDSSFVPGDEVVRLSEREHQILLALGEGRSARELSQELYISPNTMKTHLRHIYRKLGVRSRQEALQVAHRLGITPGSPSK